MRREVFKTDLNFISIFLDYRTSSRIFDFIFTNLSNFVLNYCKDLYYWNLRSLSLLLLIIEILDSDTNSVYSHYSFTDLKILFYWIRFANFFLKYYLINNIWLNLMMIRQKYSSSFTVLNSVFLRNFSQTFKQFSWFAKENRNIFIEICEKARNIS